MTKQFNNLIVVLGILIFVSLYCGNSSNSNSNPSKIKAIGGSVFPASEVCGYQKGTVLDKYGGLNKSWQKVTYESQDPNAIYFCEPTDKSLEIKNASNGIDIALEYEAWGGNPQGAFVIKLEYWAKSDTSFQTDVEQKLRAKIYIPYCNEITKKALKTDLPKSMVEKLQTLKGIGSPTGVKAKPFCEKVGQGFGCITNNISQTDNLVDFKLFASEEAYQSYMNGDI